jgi:hypothetical protein
MHARLQLKSWGFIHLKTYIKYVVLKINPRSPGCHHHPRGLNYKGLAVRGPGAPGGARGWLPFSGPCRVTVRRGKGFVWQADIYKLSNQNVVLLAIYWCARTLWLTSLTPIVFRINLSWGWPVNNLKFLSFHWLVYPWVKDRWHYVSLPNGHVLFTKSKGRILLIYYTRTVPNQLSYQNPCIPLPFDLQNLTT